jgi:hypothetical protein
MARNALAKFGLAAVYILAAEAVASKGAANHWVVQVTSTEGETRFLESDDAESIAAALSAIGEHEEASMIESAAHSARVRNQPPSAWSLGP